MTKKEVKPSIPRAVEAAIVSGKRPKTPKHHQPAKAGVLADLERGDRFTKRG